MTTNQIEYLKYLETARNNRAIERLRSDELTESKRSNVARETETFRNNFVVSQETARANKARESETRRSNRANERINRDKAYVDAYVKDKGNKLSWESSMISLTEQNRHNLATEKQATRAQDEIERSNRVYESIGLQNASTNAANVGLGYANLAENTRKNMASEALTSRQITSTYLSSMFDRRVNQQNADSNSRNANSNARNSFINLLNASINRQNAVTNKQNAGSNARNAATNVTNANVNLANVGANYIKAIGSLIH